MMCDSSRRLSGSYRLQPTSASRLFERGSRLFAIAHKDSEGQLDVIHLGGGLDSALITHLKE
jgi:hypothetical protein